MEAKHLNVHYDCPYCEYKATRPFNLKYHVQSKHQGKLECKIGECDFVAQSLRKLTSHRKQHHDKNEDVKIKFVIQK